MPYTNVDNARLSRMILDNKIVRKAYVDGKLCHVDPYRATVASVGYRRVLNGLSSKAGFFLEDMQVGNVGRSYGVVTISPTNVIGQSRVFDVFGNANEAMAMAAYLNAIPTGTIVVVYTYDEPQTNRTSNGLRTAMERCGSGTLFTGSGFKYRGAYALIGAAGIGKGKGREFYAGSADDNISAILEVNFKYMDGVVSDVVRIV